MAINAPRNSEDETLDYYSEKARSLAEQAAAGKPSPPSEHQSNALLEQPLETDALQEFTRHLKPGGRVLDAGCGAGHHLRYFLEQGFQSEGFDGSAEVLKLAGQNLQPWLDSASSTLSTPTLSSSTSPSTSLASTSRLKLWKADFRLLSLPKEHYDGIWANRVLIHLPPPGCQRVMQAFFSALKPGGILFVSFEAKADAQIESDSQGNLSSNPSSNSSSNPSSNTSDESLREKSSETSQESFAKITERDDLLGPARHLYQYPPQEFESLVRQSGFQPLSTGRDLQHPERMAILAKRI